MEGLGPQRDAQPRRVRALESRLSALLLAGQCFRGALRWALGLRICGLSARRISAKSGLAWPRNAIRVHACRAHGFLFTAVRTWTGESTPTGRTLAGFALLWVSGRILVLSPYATAAAVVNVAFPIGVAIAIGIPLGRRGNRRNYMFVALLLLLGVAALVLHLSQLGMTDWPERMSLQVGLDLVMFIIAAMSGRYHSDIHQQLASAGQWPSATRSLKSSRWVALSSCSWRISCRLRRL